MSWPLKYRPRQLEDLALIDVREQLKKLMSGDITPQVFLFAGPKGAGKTSTARIISSLLNDNLDSQELEKISQGNSYIVNEMDAASNRGIDDVRVLKDRIALPPQLGKKAVYILDEAHMLTNEAFNALLKVLEEPPAHAVFILATTELHKIPDTIISRANLIKFRQATDQELKEVLSKILNSEKIKYDEDALEAVVARADGSFRNGVKILESVCRGSKKLTLADLDLLGDSSLNQTLQGLISSVIAKKDQKVVEIFQNLRASGEDEKFVYKSLLTLLHRDLLAGFGLSDAKPINNEKINLFLLENLKDLQGNENGVIPFLSLEITLLDLILKAKEKSNKSSANNYATSVKKNPPEQKKSLKIDQSGRFDGNVEFDQAQPLDDLTMLNLSRASDSVGIVREVVSDVVQSNFRSDNLVSPDLTNYTSLVEVWDDFLGALENHNLSLAAILKSSKLIDSGDGVTKIGVFYKFHKMQLEQQKLYSILTSCGQEVAGGVPKFEFVLLSPSEKDEQSTQENSELVPAESGSLENDVSEALL